MGNKFDVILADPPWKYNSRRASASKFGGGACFHYSLMSDNELLAMPVKQVASENAVLFLWATWPRLDFAMQLIKEWGFTYKTCAFDWFKTNPSGDMFFGVGYYSKSNSEPCLLATRGDVLKPDSNSVSMAIDDYDQEAFKAQRREHSRKPEEAHRRIEKLYPQARKLEMFARQPRKGWVVWGNETNDVPLIETVNQPIITEVDIKLQQVSFFD